MNKPGIDNKEFEMVLSYGYKDKVFIVPFNKESFIIRVEDKHCKVEKYGIFRKDLLKKIK